jgi:hypothetical protein
VKKLILILVLFVLTFALFGIVEAGRSGITTVNLRACIDGGDGVCQTAGDLELDGVTICWRPAGEVEQCGQTEDVEWWFDSLPQGSYWARTEGLAGYRLVGASCTTHPNIPYSPCHVNGSRVHFVVRKGLESVNVNFSFTAE